MSNFLHFLYIFTYAVSVVGFFTLGTLVALRQKLVLYRSFTVFTWSIGLWQLLQFVAQVLNSSTLSDEIFRTSIAVVPFVAVSFLIFIQAYIGRRPSYWLYSVSPLLSVIVLFSSSLAKASISQEGIAVPSIDWQYGLVLLFAAGLFVAGLARLVRSYWNAPSQSRRSQSKTLLYGILQAVAIVTVTSIIWADTEATQIVVPVTTFIALFLIAHAIVYYKLFDMHVLVLRAASYLAALVALGGIFVLPVLLIIGWFVGVRFTPFKFVVSAIIVLLVAAIYEVVRKQFNRLTDRLFFRNYYDPRDIIDRLNRVLVSTIDLDSLLGRSAEFVSQQIKIQTCKIDVVEEVLLNAREGETNRDTLDRAETESLQAIFKRLKQNFFITDELSASDNDFKDRLTELGISVVVAINPKKNFSSSMGYMFVGPKKNGSYYTTQDTRMLETIANEMIIAIQNALHFEQIQNFNLTLQQKVDDATRQLRHANQRLKALDETKDDFISMASHQLRTPLTSVKGYLSMVLDGDAGKLSKMQHDMLHQAFISSQRMVYLISDLLNVSRLKTGKFVIESTPVNLADIIIEEMDQLKESAEARQVKLDFKRPPKFPEFMLDDTKIRQVIMNFMDNAVYYTRPGGIVTISLEETDKKVELRVKDNGIGVPKAEQYRLFTKFYRAGNARKVRPDGTGLGLFMAKKVIVAQGGAVIFDSQEGKGSTFGFSFDKSTVLVPSK